MSDHDATNQQDHPEAVPLSDEVDLVGFLELLDGSSLGSAPVLADREVGQRQQAARTRDRRLVEAELIAAGRFAARGNRKAATLAYRNVLAARPADDIWEAQCRAAACLPANEHIHWLVDRVEDGTAQAAPGRLREVARAHFRLHGMQTIQDSVSDQAAGQAREDPAVSAPRSDLLDPMLFGVLERWVGGRTAYTILGCAVARRILSEEWECWCDQFQGRHRVDRQRNRVANSVYILPLLYCEFDPPVSIPPLLVSLIGGWVTGLADLVPSPASRPGIRSSPWSNAVDTHPHRRVQSRAENEIAPLNLLPAQLHERWEELIDLVQDFARSTAATVCLPASHLDPARHCLQVALRSWASEANHSQEPVARGHTLATPEWNQEWLAILAALFDAGAKDAACGDRQHVDVGERNLETAAFSFCQSTRWSQFRQLLDRDELETHEDITPNTLWTPGALRQSRADTFGTASARRIRHSTSPTVNGEIPTRDDARHGHVVTQQAKALADLGDAEALNRAADEGEHDAALQLARLLAERGDIVDLTAYADVGDHVAAEQLARRHARQDAREHADDTDCSDVLAEVWLFLDNESDESRRRLLAQHLDESDPCLSEYGIDENLKQLLASKCGGEHAPPELKNRLRQQIWTKVLEQAGVSNESRPEGTITTAEVNSQPGPHGQPTQLELANFDQNCPSPVDVNH